MARTPAATGTAAVTTTAAAATGTAAGTGAAAGTGTAAADGDTVQLVEEGELAPFLAGPDGMTLYGPEGAHHVPAGVAEVRDATGAGDTTAATVALALATGATPVEATVLAGVAAAAVVQRDGVATVTVADLDPT